MKTYLITGGAGFIGSHLAENLLEKGEKVLSIDDLSTGSISNISFLRDKFPKTFFHYTQKIEEDERLVSELVDEADVIFHLAAVVGVKLVVDEPTKTLMVNSKCTEIILKHAAKKGKKTIITSTSECYGKSSENGEILKENGDSLLGTSYNSRWGYAISKLFDEHLALAYHKEKKLPVTIVRLFNTVGPRQTGRYGMVIPRFIESALENKPIEVYGDGNQTRCFGYVKDIVNALVSVSQEKEAEGEIYNLGNDKEISIKDLAVFIKEKLNSNSEIKFIPYDQAYGAGFEDMKKRIPDTSKIKNLIGWEAKTSLGEIITSVAEWFKDNDEIKNF